MPPRRPHLFSAILAMMLTIAGCPARAQSDIRMRIGESADALRTAAALGRLDPAQRVRTVEFIGGSALFILTHELGHAVIDEFNLPVLGRAEDAAELVCHPRPAACRQRVHARRFG